MTPETARILLHAYVDGELDAAATIDLKAQIEASAALRQELTYLSALQHAVQNRATRFKAPPNLADRVFAAAPALARRADIPAGVASWWRSLAIGATVTALALLFLSGGLLFKSRDHGAVLLEEIVGAHVRSLMADHLTDLASAERHSVKPWLSSRLDFAPPVHDLEGEGFSLVGGRLDYLGGKAAAAIVYRYRQHVINVFVWPAAISAQNTIRPSNHRGYNTVTFESGGMVYWAVSDLNHGDLHKLAELIQRHTREPQRAAATG
jgi:anti-sigma factor RsiW